MIDNTAILITGRGLLKTVIKPTTDAGILGDVKNAFAALNIILRCRSVNANNVENITHKMIVIITPSSHACTAVLQREHTELFASNKRIICS